MLMSNRLTRVPELPPPSLNNFTWIVRVADFAMKSLLSTPESGTLRTTWVTPATLGISYLAVMGCAAVIVLGALHYQLALAPVVEPIVVVVFGAVGLLSAAVAGTGTLQRLYFGKGPT